MSIQEQLAQSQQSPPFPSFITRGVPLEAGVLGNQSLQVPTKSAGVLVILRSEAPVAAAPPAPTESPEMGWLVRNAAELSGHKGEWLLIQGMRLIIHSRDFAAVRQEIRARQIRSPFVYYVPTDDESNSITI